MIFPLQKRVLIRGFDAHKKAGLGGAADYEAEYKELFSPVSGKVRIFDEDTGGQWIAVTGADGTVFEFAHLKSRFVETGHQILEGQMIGVTGNTGKVTTGPHLHVQIKDWKGNRLDPEKVFGDLGMPKETYNLTAGKIIRDNPDVNKFVRLNLERIFEGFRQKVFGHVDRVGLEADVNRVMAKMYEGSDFEGKLVIEDYVNSQEWEDNWQKS